MIKSSAVTVGKETSTGHTWIFAIFVSCCFKHVSDKKHKPSERSYQRVRLKTLKSSVNSVCGWRSVESVFSLLPQFLGNVMVRFCEDVFDPYPELVYCWQRKETGIALNTVRSVVIDARALDL